MRVGIIAEGVTDIAVIRNILKSVLNIDTADTLPIRPELSTDETDLANTNMSEREFGSWTHVKTECENKTEINKFFQVAEKRFLIIQIDSDTAQEYGIPSSLISPTNKADVTTLRQAIITQIKGWLATSKFDDNIVYAVAIQAIESWLLTLYLPNTVLETGLLPNPKDRFEKAINRSKLSPKEKNKLFSKSAYDRYLEISKPFAKSKTLKPCLDRNQSLKEFCEDLLLMQ